MTYIVAFSDTGAVFRPPIFARQPTVTPPVVAVDATTLPCAQGDLPDGAMVDVRVAARIVGLAKSTLDKKRVYGGGPVFAKYPSGAVRYSVRELRRWIRVNSTASTSEHWAAR
ncbi:helix-turn-helix transcriptional regulator [Sphingomonas paucimobilis]|uniref:helix-turn-helix transcriptional regulator n=1 Tax=Sphingomonas paucimobilis TaxID=13689 RepID=UPI0037B8B9B5